jgi:hypothetical protein
MWTTCGNLNAQTVPQGIHRVEELLSTRVYSCKFIFLLVFIETYADIHVTTVRGY